MRPAWLVRHWFTVGLAGAAVLGFVAPALGARGGPLAPEVTTRAGVALIFFLQGLTLAPAALRQGARHWRLHVATQLFIFVAFPVVVFAAHAVAGEVLGESLRRGFLYLAVLPTTIAGCVVLTAAAGGNVAGAIFNSALANVAGVVLTPALVALLLDGRSGSVALLPMIGEVALLLVVPLAAGQAVRPVLLRRLRPDARLSASISNAVILFIVYTAFATSVHAGAFRATDGGEVLLVAGAALALFAGATAAAWLLGRRLGFGREDRAALLFCGPHKTLAAGAPMAQVIFAGDPAIGLLLLPLMVYHFVQLAGGAALADRLRAGAAEALP